MANNITTVKLLKSTKDRLDKLRVHRRETYDDILQRVLSILNLSRAQPEMAQHKLMGIERQKRIVERRKIRNDNTPKLIKKKSFADQLNENITTNFNRKILKDRK